MELLFSGSSRLQKLKSDGLPEYKKPLCTISTANVVAFTSSAQLTGKQSFKEFPDIGGSNIYIADLDKPWQPEKIFSCEEEANALEWDVGGSRLLVADSAGRCQFWGMKDHIINDWHMIGSVDLHNEHVIALEWLHKGSKLILSHDKDTVRYSDKFQRVPVHDFRPSVVHFGGRPMDGWIAVTATGLVCVTLISPNKEVKTLYESLSAVRSKMILADVAYCNNGDLMVVTSDGLISSAVRCFKVSIKAQHGGADFTVTCQPMASFFMKTYTTNHQSCQYGKISHLRFAWKEGTNALLTCAAGNSGSCVEFWEMKEQASPVHKVFQSAGGGSGEYKSLKWKYVDTILHTSEVSAVTSSRLSPSDGALIPHYSGIVAYKDSSIKLLYRSSVTQVAAVTMENIVRLASDSGLSQSTMAGELTCMRQSTTGYIMVGVDIYSQMFVYRLSTSRDTYFQTGTLLATNHIVNLLEYCMLNGYDWFDVLLCVRPGYIDSVCDWLTDSFMKQPASIQQVYYNKYLTIKASLYRRLAYGQGKAGDCIARLLLNAVATCLHSVLRPSMLSGQEKGPVEKLTNLMRANKSEADLTSMLSLVKATETKAREYIVEPSVLQCLQQLLQWITDFTLYLLALLPTQHVHKTEHPGCGLLNDVSALHTLRELLLLIRLWGLLNPNCLPNFTATSDNLDCMALLFQLLTKAIHSCSSSEPDESLIDECSLLPSQVLIPSVDLGVNGRGLSSANLSSQQQPYHFEYDVPPQQSTKYEEEPPEVTFRSQQKLDAIRKVQLGICPAISLKQCTRCSCMSALSIGVRSPATRWWDQHWVKSCLCGGHWRSSN